MTDLILTGSTGFIGSNLKKFVKNTDFRIFEITRTRVISTGCETVFHKNDPLIMLEALKKANQPIIINLAALFKRSHTPASIAPLIRSNIEFSTMIFEVGGNLNSRGILNFGTVWQFSENGKSDPTNLYAATKTASECILKFYSKVMYDSYGANDPRQKIVQLLLEYAKSGKELKMRNGENPINLTFVTDVCQGIIRAVEAIKKRPRGSHCRWAIRNPKTYRVYDLVKLVDQSISEDLKVRFGALPEGVQPKSLDLSIPTVPNWVPEVDLEHGLKSIIESYNN